VTDIHQLDHYATYQMNFMPEESVYYVSLESQVSINYCLVQSDADIRLIDVERNLALLSTIKSKVKLIHLFSLIFLILFYLIRIIRLRDY